MVRHVGAGTVAIVCECEAKVRGGAVSGRWCGGSSRRCGMVVAVAVQAGCSASGDPWRSSGYTAVWPRRWTPRVRGFVGLPPTTCARPSRLWKMVRPHVNFSSPCSSTLWPSGTPVVHGRCSLARLCNQRFGCPTITGQIRSIGRMGWDNVSSSSSRACGAPLHNRAYVGTCAGAADQA